MKKRIQYLSYILAEMGCLILWFLLPREHPIATLKTREKRPFALQIQATGDRLQSRQTSGADILTDFRVLPNYY